MHAASSSSRQSVEPSEKLIEVIQSLSLARDLDSIREIVRHAARELTGADGATFILRDGEFCYYMDEDAIGPLWKGRRFPMTTCISGWSMVHQEPVVIDDIYVDCRIPVDAYRPTFVKSLAMVPIRRTAPIGAIGNYWAHHHHAESAEMKLLQALADSTSIAMENVEVYAQLEQRVRDRTAQLEATNKELEAFSYSVSHDLSAPLRAIKGFAEILVEEHAGKLDQLAQQYLMRVVKATERMSVLIEDLLRLSRITGAPLNRRPVNLTDLAHRVAADIQARDSARQVEIQICVGMRTTADAPLLTLALENLIGNAWKFASKVQHPLIQVGQVPGNESAYYVRDNGAGFDGHNACKLFTPFQRFHDAKDFEGTGIGLSIVHRVISRHGGRLWAEAEQGHGATFFFSLGVA